MRRKNQLAARGKRTITRTDPAQNISDGHHACFGGRGCCDGKSEPRAAVALGTEVITVSVGGEVSTPAGAVAVAEAVLLELESDADWGMASAGSGWWARAWSSRHMALDFDTILPATDKVPGDDEREGFKNETNLRGLQVAAWQPQAPCFYTHNGSSV